MTEISIFTGYRLSHDFEKLASVTTAEGRHELIFKNIGLENAGTYYCKEDINSVISRANVVVCSKCVCRSCVMVLLRTFILTARVQVQVMTIIWVYICEYIPSGVINRYQFFSG